MKIFDHFQHINLTNDQHNALEKIQDFLASDENIFILQGYAGTGKTTLLRGLCSYFKEMQRSYHLMAPTGRAAMILNEKTKERASTIHRHIYNFDNLLEKEDDSSFKYYYGLRPNEDSSQSIYLIDEASMISDYFSDDEFFMFGSGYLLKDLYDYSFTGIQNRKIIFVGDNAQLPPVNMNFSPALDKKYLFQKYNLNITEFLLKEVIRQETESGILKSATNIRNSIEKHEFNKFRLDYNVNDISKISPESFIEMYTQTAKKIGIENMIVITHSNKQALGYNQLIRNKRYGEKFNVLQEKDLLIITKNNYKGQVELFNGMFANVIEVGGISYTTVPRFKIKGGKTIERQLVFRDVIVDVKTGNNESKRIKTTILDNFLTADEGRLHPYDQRALFVDFKNRMSKKGIKPKSEEFKESLQNDIYFNALQAKYGYAITCHKSQGGEWKTTFVDFKVFIGKQSLAFYRWSYTALTRAKEFLFSIDAPDYNSLSTFVIKEIIKLSNVPGKRFYVPTNNSPEDFIAYRLERIEKLFKNENIVFKRNIYNNQVELLVSKGELKGKVQLWFKKDGFSKTSWGEFNNNDFNELVKVLVDESIFPINIPFLPKFRFQEDLHQYFSSLIQDEGLAITNIIQKEWSDLYYIKTDAECALIEFWFNDKHFYTYAQPHSTAGSNDIKLNAIVSKLRGN